MSADARDFDAVISPVRAAGPSTFTKGGSMRKPVAVALLVGLSGCGTIMQGTRQEVPISSTPTGAQVIVDGQQLGTTPLVAELKRGSSHTIAIRLPGYQPAEFALAKGVSGWVWGNLVFGGIPGLAVDAISGGMYKLTPDQVQATLLSGGAYLSPGDGAKLSIMVVLGASPGWEKVGQLSPE